MTKHTVSEIQETLRLFGAEYGDASPSKEFANWLSTYGCTLDTAELLALIFPDKTISLATFSFDLGNIYDSKESVACSTGRNACRLLIAEAGFLVVGDSYSPSLYLVSFSAPFTGPTYSLNYFDFGERTTLKKKDLIGMDANWFQVLRNLRSRPDTSVRFLCPHYSALQRREVVTELAQVFNSQKDESLEQ